MRELSDISVSPQASIRVSLEILDRGHRRILLVTDDDGRLLGVATDSDFRRAMLARIDFDAPIATIMTRNPVVVGPKTEVRDALALMERTHCHELPVIDASGVVVKLLLIEDLLSFQAEKRDRVAVVMAGGLGSRLRPLTDSTPKPLIQVGDRPILFTVLDRLLAGGFNKIYVSVNYLADDIIARVSAAPHYKRVQFLREEAPLGTGGALSLLPVRPDAPFVVVNADLLTTAPFDEMLRFHEREQNVMTIALREEKFPLPYGIVTLEGAKVTSIVEKPTLTHFVNAGAYVLNPSLLDHIQPNTPMDMPTLAQISISAGRRVGSFPIHEYWIDIGQLHQLERARQDYHSVFVGHSAFVGDEPDQERR